MTRVGYRFYRVVSWARYTVPRRLTPAGGLVLAATLGSGAIGADMDRSVAFKAFAFGLCLLSVAALLACFFRGRFAAERLIPRFGSVGQSLTYHVTVRNRTSKAFRDLELLEELEDPRPARADFPPPTRYDITLKGIRVTRSQPWPTRHRQAIVKTVALPGLEPRGETEVRMELLPLRRGPLRFIGLTVARPDPFGLLRGFVRVPAPQTIVILPKRYALPPIALPGARQYQRGGVALASAIGESEEFVSLRDYRPGDPRRHIHWRSWARTGRPIVREFQDEFFVRHALILDTFVGPEKAKAFEEAISIAASFACTLDAQEALLDLMFVGAQAVCFTTGRGLGHVEQALEILASVRPCREKPFEALKDLVLSHASGVCGCICVFVDWDEPRRELIHKLRAIGLPLLVLVVADAVRASELRSQTDEERPDNFYILETGKIAAGLPPLEGIL